MSTKAYTILSFTIALFILISPVELANTKASDISKLWSIRSSFSQAKDVLPSWFNSEIPPCSWHGIKCINFSVISINLFNIPLNSPFPQLITEFGSLRDLNLSGCGLKGPLPELPGSNLCELEVLDLSNNGLTGPIPDWITSLTSLNQLVLSSNSFSANLGSSIGFLKNLVILRISEGSFSGNLPPELGLLQELEKLDLSANNFTGSIPSSFANLSKLVHLDISRNRLTGNIFPGIGSLVNLQTLDLSSNGLTGPIPSSVGKLVKLESLWLGFNGFTGTIPIEVGNLERLGTLSLTSSKLTGSIPGELINLKALTDLDLSENKFEGELPSNIGELKDLMFLIAANAGLTGRIPASLGQCTNLKILDLSFNFFSGPLPGSLARLGSIGSFMVEGNQLSGQIPEWIRNWKVVNSLYFSNNTFTGELPPLPLQNLTTFSADANQLSGGIPSRICEATSLNYLSLSENELTGTIGETFKECRNLTDLVLSGNKLSGEIPGYLSELPLVTLEMLQNNFTGPLPDKLFESKTLMELSLSSNGLTGQIPASVGHLSGLQRLQLDNNLFTGLIPKSIGKLKNMTNLSLHGNKLSGEIPIELFDCTNLVALDLGSNEFTGSIPASISLLIQLNNLVLSNNQLSGEIPDGICTGYSSVANIPDSEFYQHYGVLDLSYNSITGRIPTGVRKCLVLKELRLQGNMLTGTIPSELFELTNLTYIDLSFNSLTGQLNLFSFNKLQGLILSHNGLTGSIPDEIGSLLPSLFKLDISSNRFTGSLPVSVFSIKGLTDLDVSQNSLSGTIIPFFHLTGTSSLLIFNGSNNNFSGMVENSISNFTSLSVLDLHGNQLTGVLPMSISKLDYLRYIDLSENNFQDLIPCGICAIDSLSYVNFSGNRFRGFYPENCAFKTDFGSNNPCLASHIVPLVAELPPHPPKRSSVWHATLAIVASFLAILMALLAWKLLKQKPSTLESIGTKSKSGSSTEPVSSDELLGKRTREPLSINLATFEHSLLRVTAEDILQATDNFSKAHIIGDGGNGTVYKALLSSGAVAVKRLHGTHFGGGDREFLAEMETIGKVKHQNLVPLLGYCVFRDERFLIYEYMVNGSLEEWLRKGGADVVRERLGWARMLEIMLGSARGLAFLHHGFVPHIIHRDMKSSNILLDENFEPRVSDFGFARIISACETHVSTDIAGTIGYFPPEYGLTMQITAKGDVYSFGVVMLEMLTGRAPTGQDEAEGGGNLVGWVRWMVGKNREDEVFDPCLPSMGPERQQMSRVLAVARVCTCDEPWRRPNMLDVVRMLKEIKMLHEGDDVVIISV